MIAFLPWCLQQAVKKLWAMLWDWVAAVKWTEGEEYGAGSSSSSATTRHSLWSGKRPQGVRELHCLCPSLWRVYLPQGNQDCLSYADLQPATISWHEYLQLTWRSPTTSPNYISYHLSSISNFVIYTNVSFMVMLITWVQHKKNRCVMFSGLVCLFFMV